MILTPGGCIATLRYRLKGKLFASVGFVEPNPTGNGCVDCGLKFRACFVVSNKEYRSCQCECYFERSFAL